MGKDFVYFAVGISRDFSLDRKPNWHNGRAGRDGHRQCRSLCIVDSAIASNWRSESTDCDMITKACRDELPKLAGVNQRPGAVTPERVRESFSRERGVASRCNPQCVTHLLVPPASFREVLGRRMFCLHWISSGFIRA